MSLQRLNLPKYIFLSLYESQDKLTQIDNFFIYTQKDNSQSYKQNSLIN